MSNPIPLSAPDGTVCAWACGECRRVSQPWVVHPQFDVMPADASRESRRLAERCCPDLCPGCRVPAGGLCRGCCADARRAFEVLAAIGMAVAMREYADVCVRIATLGGGRTGGRGERQVGIVAALCGVSPETVRGWR